MEQFPTKPFYTPAELAEILSTSHSHITKLISDGTIDAVRVSPRVTRIPYGEVMRLIGRPLSVSRRHLSPAEAQDLRDELTDEEVPASAGRLVAAK